MIEIKRYYEKCLGLSSWFKEERRKLKDKSLKFKDEREKRKGEGVRNTALLTTANCHLFLLLLLFRVIKTKTTQ